jgi:type III restriction enzyme
MLQLKEYQERALEALRSYLRRAGEIGPNVAFYEATEEKYLPAPGLEDLPYVCLRVPTGGGKTLMASHAVGILTRELLHAERSVVLWLVPTNQIREQTLAALRDREHPYRQALQAGLGGGPVAVMDLAEALYVPRAAVDGQTCVIVSTLAAPRVTNTEDRKIYETAGALMSHFDGLTEQQQALLESDQDGTIAYSLANVLRLRRPIVIMDEAHNARTELSFETFVRFQPSCILEFTATPEREDDPKKGRHASNVLCHVSAWELKAEAMIKMPIRLHTQRAWRDVVGDAVRKRAELEKIASAEEAESGKYLRPIVLVQAQPRSRTHDTLTVEVIEETLQEDFAVPPEQIRVATGDRREIAGEDLLSRDCPVRFIITVQALKEGWDCSFAYVLCSVADIRASTSVEQILGRILRLPHAERRPNDALNEAYAYVLSQNFAETAGNLRDGLVNIGFHRLESLHMVTASQSGLFPADSLFGDAAARQIKSPSERGEIFRVPALARRSGDQLHLWEPEDFLSEDWDLSDCSHELTENEFALSVRRELRTVDVDKNGIKLSASEQVRAQLALLQHEEDWTHARLVAWLDRNIPHPDVPQAQSHVFLWRLVDHLVSERGLSLSALTRERFRLRGAAQAKIAEHRERAKKEGLQRLLLDVERTSVGPDVSFTFAKGMYPLRHPYEGSYEFPKHFYPQIDDLKPGSAEERCAVAIDDLKGMKHWVRNIPQKPMHSFWLPTTSDRFYPDFVAELQDGTYLVVEYKGEHLRTGDDAEEKDIIGKVWEECSHGCCRFFMATHENLHELEKLVQS